MPSFDIVSEVDFQELDNAVNIAEREIANRFDFRGAEAQISFDKPKKTITLVANNEQKVENMFSVLQSKAHKRGIDILSFEVGKIIPKAGALVKQDITLKEGIDKEQAKKINVFIKDLKLKVQSQINDDKIRVTGKKRDDLQQVMQALKGKKFDVPLQYNNFRD